MRLIKTVFLLLVLIGCKPKKNTPIVPDSTSLKNGMMVLCEGLFQQNNSAISWVDFSTGISDDLFFTNKTNRLLGDTGNDIQTYGGKIYVSTENLWFRTQITKWTCSDLNLASSSTKLQ